MKIVGESQMGLARQENQDVYYEENMANATLVAVFDGMGGAAGGRTAAVTAAAVFFTGMKDGLGSNARALSSLEIRRVFGEAVYEANRAVFERGATEPGLRGMGTTMAAVLAVGDRLYAANVGDSRIYLFRGGEATRVSRDDSFVQQEIDAGRMTEEEAFLSEKRNLLTAVLGQSGYADFHFAEAAFKPGDVLLLCSDGLTGHLNDREIGAIVSAGFVPEAIVSRLIEETYARGARDNVTVAVMVP